MFRGNYREATDYLLRNDEPPTVNVRTPPSHSLSQFPSMGGPGNYIWTQAYAAWCFAELRAFDDGIASGKQSQRAAAIFADPWAYGTADEFLGYVYLRRGHLDHAVPLLERCLQRARTMELPILLIQVAPRLGCGYNMLGRFTESIELLEEATSKGEAAHYMAWVPLVYAYLAEA